jgi:hypothetical protein
MNETLSSLGSRSLGALVLERVRERELVSAAVLGAGG